MHLASSADHDYPINVWPKPRTFSWPKPQAIPLSPIFAITSPDHQYLTPAVKRYLNQVLTEHHRPLVTPAINLTSALPLLTLSISVNDLVAPLHHGVNESYVLSIPASGPVAYLAAETAWGAMRGLESFSQLVWGYPSRVASDIYIWDEPLYQHRGVMLDTSRNYFGVDDLLRTIGAMSMNKLNVFHWHITDSHSFPLVLPSLPSLSEKGAYGPEMVYTPEDIKMVVEFGMEYGVRVVPEVDMPAHTATLAEVYPEIVTCANMFWLPAGADWPDRLAAEPGTGHLNPLIPKTYEVVENLIQDVISMFPEPFYHGGADEVVPNCWKQDSTIQNFLANNGTLSRILEIFISKTYPYIASRNRTVVYWEDVLLDAEIHVDASFLPKENTILQIWTSPGNVKRVVSAGYRAIVSTADLYYLDCGHGDFVGNNSLYDKPPGTIKANESGSWCGPFKTWQTIYNYDITYGLTAEEAKLVIGGEVALWTEQADPTVLDPRIWPRSSAMAESLWSGNTDDHGMKRYGFATDRLNEWRYRMVNRGIGAEPIQPLWCVRHPGMCNAVQG
ncbi:Beta-hexosaminidase [Heracleum sosnowskyi]|uniref:Beta-hexosaminidase n=1 Tax=Heracleum sosnowskyi TaxID=360622 RepID=A0AAD8IX11_9APIA|nr:Beta-hexosaminidase [Heracleum sosnowskyi]